MNLNMAVYSASQPTNFASLFIGMDFVRVMPCLSAIRFSAATRSSTSLLDFWSAYLKDVLTRLPTHRASRIEELLPHRWQGANA